MSRKTQQARRKALNEHKALKAIYRRQKREHLERHMAQSRRPAPHKKSPLQQLDAILARQEHNQTPLSNTLVEMTRCHPADHDRVQRFRALVAITQRKLPGVLVEGGVWLLWFIAEAAWERPLDTWKPRGKITTTRVRSLLRHLLLKYRAPDYLLVELARRSEAEGLGAEERDVLQARLDLLVTIGRGDSMKSAQKRNLLPAVLTKRMLHQLRSTPAGSLVQAIRKVQVATFGGSPQLAAQINATFLGEQHQNDASFWQGAIQWFCGHHMLNPGQIRPMLDYIHHQHLQDGALPWSIKGRTVNSLIRDMEEWHAVLNQIRLIKSQTFSLSGFLEARFELKTRGKIEIWRMAEILTTRALAAEGRKMRHCVYSYRRAIEKGTASLWSITCNAERVLTVEVCNRSSSIVQVRGRANRRPTQKERGLLARWATTARLTLKEQSML